MNPLAVAEEALLLVLPGVLLQPGAPSVLQPAVVAEKALPLVVLQAPAPPLAVLERVVPLLVGLLLADQSVAGLPLVVPQMAVLSVSVPPLVVLLLMVPLALRPPEEQTVPKAHPPVAVDHRLHTFPGAAAQLSELHPGEVQVACTWCRKLGTPTCRTLS